MFCQRHTCVTPKCIAIVCWQMVSFRTLLGKNETRIECKWRDQKSIVFVKQCKAYKNMFYQKKSPLFNFFVQEAKSASCCLKSDESVIKLEIAEFLCFSSRFRLFTGLKKLFITKMVLYILFNVELMWTMHFSQQYQMFLQIYTSFSKRVLGIPHVLNRLLWIRFNPF